VLLFSFLPFPLFSSEPISYPSSLTSPSCVGCALEDPILSHLTPEERKKLGEGKVLVKKVVMREREEEATAEVMAMVMIPRSPEQVYHALFTFSRWPHFLPNLTAVKVLKTEGEELWLWHEVKVLFVSVEYTVIYRFDPQRGIARWTLDRTLPHDIEDTEGFWRIEPLKGKGALLIYKARVKVGRFVPQFVEDLLTRESLPKVVTGVKEEVLRRFP
jgi:ribosome-associated toxin RatA of RatAB toxin-antitoxin module